ncbi:MAG TPA: ABC transporter permease subunit [Streptosporangiaceae bacterium]|nr:ABC transporter permease subunit [Streptosporangiaceae bacterium]
MSRAEAAPEQAGTERAGPQDGSATVATVTVATSAALLPVDGDGRDPVRSWLRLLRSEVSLVFRRWRNVALLAVVVVLPVMLGIALRLAAPQPSGGGGGGGGPNAFLIDQLAGNGVFLAFVALTIMMTLVLPLTVAVVSGDSVAGESSLGTLRYLLTVPAGRTRLLAVKYVAVVLFGLTACVLVSVASLLAGIALFPVGPVTLLSGTTVSLADGLLRLLFVTLYIAAGMAALAAIGLAISTLTEHPIAAIAATLVLAVASEVADNVPQFAVVQPYLPTHWWLSFDAFLRSPVDTSAYLHGLLSFGVYAALFVSIAWARLSTADVTS